MVGQVVVRSADADRGDDPGDPPPGPPPGLEDAVAPRLAGLVARGRQSRRRVQLAFRASEPATAALFFDHRPLRSGGARATGARFRRYAKQTVAVRAGANRVALRALGGRPIRRGAYRVKLRLTDAAGNISRLGRLSFTVR
jgi:hypothetical protein